MCLIQNINAMERVNAMPKATNGVRVSIRTTRFVFAGAVRKERLLWIV